MSIDATKTEARGDALADARKLETVRTISIEGMSVSVADVLKSLRDTEIEREAANRGLLDDEDDWEPRGIDERDLNHSVPAWLVRQDIPKALRGLEGVLSRLDSRFIGFADDVERHYARAA